MAVAERMKQQLQTCVHDNKFIYKRVAQILSHSFFMMERVCRKILIIIVVISWSHDSWGLSNHDTLFFDKKKFSKPQGLYSRTYHEDVFLSADYTKSNTPFSLVLHLTGEGSSKAINLLIAPIETDSVYVGNNIACANVNRVRYIKAGNDLFELYNLNVSKSYVLIKKVTGVKADIELDEGLIPNQSFKTVQNTLMNFRQLLTANKYLYVSIWGLWCPPCIEKIPALKKLYDQYQEKVEIVALNYRDQITDVRQFVKLNEIPWMNGFTNDALNRQFYVEGYPHGMLYDANGKLIKMNCSVSDLESILAQSVVND